MVQTIKKNCPDWIGITVRNESESVSGMDRNHCPKIIGMGVRNGSEYAFIGFRSDLPDRYMMDEDKISQIPFFDIINFFKKVHKNIDFILPMYAVKKFPQELQKKIDKYNVKYESYGSDDYFNKELISMG